MQTITTNKNVIIQKKLRDVQNLILEKQRLERRILQKIESTCKVCLSLNLDWVVLYNNSSIDLNQIELIKESVLTKKGDFS